MNGAQYFASRYQEMDVNTAKPLQLVVMLYDAAVRATEAAHGHMQRKDIAGRTREINKCSAIISELQSSLDLQKGGEIASSLNRLYDYMKRTLFQAGAEQNPAPLVEVGGLLKTLCAAWRQIATATPAASAPSASSARAAEAFTDVPLAGIAAASTTLKPFSISA